MIADGSAPWLGNDLSLRIAEHLVEISALCNFQMEFSNTDVSCYSLEQ